ncbi:MAG: long-chain fatty acid--CoA ligase [Candidatus Neomarinimicrobiota bacterium]
MTYSTIPSMFVETIKKYADKSAYFELINGEWKEYTFSDVGDLVEKFSAGLASLGIKKNDKIAIQSTNCPRWAISDYAITGLGAVTVTVYPTLISPQIQYILDDSDTQFVITQDQSQTDKVLKFIKDSPGLRGIIAMDDTHDPDSQIYGFQHVLDLGEKNIADNKFSFSESAETAQPDDLLTIIYTSGTTGNPKGVMLTHKNLVSNVIAGQAAIHFGSDDTFLSFLPLSHSFERMAGHFTAFSLGATTYYAESIDTVAENMVDVGPTIMISVPRFFEKVNARVIDKVSNDPALRQKIFWWAIGVGKKCAPYLQSNRKPSGFLGFKFKIADKLVFSKLKARVGGNLRFFVSGGAPLSKEVGEFFASANIPIIEGYGLTETSPVITANREELYKFGTVGAAVDGVEVKIAKDGEILCRGDNVMKGYYNNPEATKEVLDEDGWFYTGDIGEFDEDGYLKITDRKKSILVTSGGKNIAPAPLEIALTSSKYIEQSLVIGDRRNFISALIVPSFEVLEEWALSNNIDFGGNRQTLCDHPKVMELYNKELESTMERFSHYERVKKCSLLAKEWTIESGETTPKLSVKRKVVEDNYASIIDAMYTS